MLLKSAFFFVLQWLNEEKLVQRLTELIHAGKDEEVSAKLVSVSVCVVMMLSIIYVYTLM